MSVWERWCLNLLILERFLESSVTEWSTGKRRALEAGKTDEQNCGAGIFRTFRQSINRDGEGMNSVTNDYTLERARCEKALEQQDISNLPAEIDAAQCNENIIFPFFFASNRLPILKEIKLYLEAPESKSETRSAITTALAA